MSKTVGRGYSHYVLGALLVIYTINYMDRQIISVLSPHIKADLQLNDTQLGLLKGTAFALFYSTMAIPLAMLGDRTNRVNLIACSLTLWSAMTALCGQAANFIQLFFFRMAVGIGEAGSTPPSHALLADYFAREKRSTVLAIYSLGVPFGTLAGLILGGWLATHYGWRATLAILGIPGFLVALITKLTVRELPRGSAESGGGPAARPDPLFIVIRELWGIPSYRIMILAGSLNAFVGYALSMWMVDFYVRTQDIPLGRIGLLMAFAFGIGGGIGTFGGGMATDRFGRRDARRYFTIPGIAMTASAPLIILCVMTSSMTVSIACLFVVSGLSYASLGPLYGLVQTLSPVHNRSLAVAFYFLFQSLIGAGLGPLAVGIISDILSGIMPSDRALTYALATLCLPILVGGIALAIRARQLTHDLARLA